MKFRIKPHPSLSDSFFLHFGISFMLLRKDSNRCSREKFQFSQNSREQAPFYSYLPYTDERPKNRISLCRFMTLNVFDAVKLIKWLGLDYIFASVLELLSHAKHTIQLKSNLYVCQIVCVCIKSFEWLS